MSARKNYTLELLKLFASYMVVFIHVAFYGKIGTTIECLARFAVPFFFLISGFYSYQITPDKIKKRIRNIVSLFIFATICYTIFNVSARIINGNTDAIVSYFKRYVEISSLVNLFVFNISLTAGHFWFFLALIYVYVIFYFVTVFHINQKVVYLTAFLLLFLHIFLGELLSAVGVVVPAQFMRNFALMGIPFFALGLLAKKHEYKLRNIPNYVMVLSIIMGIIASLLSQHFFGKSELYVGSLLILFGIVSVFVKYSTVQPPLLLRELEGCSTYIFIFHAMVSVVINKVYLLFGVDIQTSKILTNLNPVFVCICSTVLAYLIIKIRKNTAKHNAKS